MTLDARPKAGDVAEVVYPFLRATYHDGDPDSSERACWKPGHEYTGTDDDENVYGVAHGVGTMRLTVVGIYQPPGFPTRVFFTRRWIDPDGREFGKGKLHIVTAGKFRRLSRGYAVSYHVVAPAEIANA